jgi:hypothetical protein
MKHERITNQKIVLSSKFELSPALGTKRMGEKVENCGENKTFEVDIKNFFFPVCGSGIVYQEWCSKETRMLKFNGGD